ncbi:MAG: hypothetical protein IT364_08245 [Candidatus Hydrogenedentes bacterium]|nr:hypothetical protein [Candidatus Hydrogenedentota bacterium]
MSTSGSSHHSLSKPPDPRLTVPILPRTRFRVPRSLLIAAVGLATFTGCPPSTGWVRLHGGENSDYGYDIQQTTDGGYIIAGVTNSFDTWNGDMYLLKIGANGNLAWYYTFGATSYDYGYAVAQADDGGYVMAGETDSFGAGGEDACLVKVDSSGDLSWFQTYGTAEDDVAFSLAKTSDDGYIMCGSSVNGQNSTVDIYLVKTDANGNEDWSRSIDCGGDEGGNSVAETDNGYVVAGIRMVMGDGSSSISIRMCLVKTDLNGNFKWMQEYGDYSAGYDVIETADGGYVVAGETDSSPFDAVGWSDGFAVRTDAHGNVAWTIIRDIRGESCFLNSVKQTSDGGYVFAGKEGTSALLLKTDEDGTEMWSRRFNGLRSISSEACAVVESSLGGYCFAGSQHNDTEDPYSVYVVKTDARGNTGLPLPVTLP